MAGSVFGKKTSQLILYGLYSLAFTAFLLYFMFPSGAVGRHVTYSIERSLPAASAKVEETYPFLGPGLVLEGLTVGIKGGRADLLVLDKVWIRPEIWSFLKGRRALYIEASGLGGSIKAKAGAGDGAGALNTELFINGIRLDALRALRELTGRTFSGTVSGEIQISAGGSITSCSARARLLAKDAGIQLRQAVMGITNLSFSEILLTASMEQGRINLGHAQFKGRQFGGSLTGSVSLAVPLTESGIDLKGTIEPQPSLFSGSEFPPEARAAVMQLAKKGKIQFTLRGKLGNPSMRFL